jgi:hypothetical protein
MPRKKKETSETKPAAPRKPKTAVASSKKLAAKPAAKPRALKAAAPKKKAAEPKTAKAPRGKKAKIDKNEDASPSPRRLPRKGETQMVAFVRDPNCIFTYWEVTPESAEEVRRQLMEEYPKSVMVLRLLRMGPNGQMQLVQEIRVKPGEMNRYVDLEGEPGSFVVEIAQKAPSGKTFVYARSQTIVTGGPAFSSSSSAVADFLASPGDEIPKAFLDYFEEGEVDQVLIHPAGVISSAEAYRMEVLRKKGDRYASSRLQ